MKHELTTEAARLLEEVGRYLEAVDLFRLLGCEPTWQPERAAALVAALDPASADPEHIRSAH